MLCPACSLSIDVVDINRYLMGAQRAGLIRVDLGANNCCGPFNNGNFNNRG